MGSEEKLALGNISIVRDWGWAPEYVDAMWRMLQRDQPDDFVVATGKSSSLQDFVAAVFECYGLDWRNHVVVDETYLRPTDIMANFANPEKAHVQLGWKAVSTMRDVARMMAAAESNKIALD